MASVSMRDAGPQGLQNLSAYSRYVQRIRRRFAAELGLLPPGVIDAAAVTALVQRLRDGGRALPSALRVARQLCLERLACLDVDGAAPLDTVTHGMTALAEATLELALAQVPTVAAYRGAGWEAALARRLIKLPSVILPNLILGRSVVPEFIQEEATADALSGHLLAAMAEGGKRQEQLDGFAEVETIMRSAGPSPAANAVDAALELVASRSGREAMQA